MSKSHRNASCNNINKRMNIKGESVRSLAHSAFILRNSVSTCKYVLNVHHDVIFVP